MNFTDKKDKILIQPFNPYNYYDTLENKNKEDILNKYTIALEVGNTNIGSIINIINNNFYPNYKNNNGDTSLHLLIKINNNFLNEDNKLHIFKILINNGADYSIKNNLSQNILHLCFKNNLFKIIDYVYSELEYTRINSNIDINNKNYLNYLLDSDQILLKKNNDFIIKKKKYIYNFNNLKNNNDIFNKLEKNIIKNIIDNKIKEIEIEVKNLEYKENIIDLNNINNLKSEFSKNNINTIFKKFKLNKFTNNDDYKKLYNKIDYPSLKQNIKKIMDILKIPELNNINDYLDNHINDINKNIINDNIKYIYYLDLYKSIFDYIIDSINTIIFYNIKKQIYNELNNLKLNDFEFNKYYDYNELDDTKEKELIKKFLNKKSYLDNYIINNIYNDYIINIYYDNNYYDMYDLYEIKYYQHEENLKNLKNLKLLMDNKKININNLINDSIYDSIIHCSDNYINYNYILLLIDIIKNNIINNKLSDIKDDILEKINFKINLYNNDLINIYLNNLIAECDNNTSLYNLIPITIKNIFTNKNINIFNYIKLDIIDVQKNNNNNNNIINFINNSNIDINTIFDLIYDIIKKIINNNKDDLFDIIVDMITNLLKKEKNIIYLKKDTIKDEFILIMDRFILVVLNNDNLNKKYNKNNFDDNKNIINEDLKKLFIELDNDYNDFEEIYDKYISNYVINLYELLILYIYKYNINMYKLIINIYKSNNLYLKL